MKAVVLSVILMVCSFANPARADSMRCGSNLVSDGDSKAKVILRCGQPFYKEQVKVESSGQSQTQGQIQKSGPETYNFSGNTSSTSQEIPIEKWFYNLGEGEFIRILTFKGDALIKIETGDKP